MLSHQLKQFEINGEKTVIQNPSENQRKENEKSTFELYEVYAIDVLLSSGEGKVSLYEIYWSKRKIFYYWLKTSLAATT